MALKVAGAAELRRAALDLRKAARKDLEKKLNAEISRSAGKRVKPAIVARAEKFLPSGYAHLLASSLSMRVRTLARKGQVTIRVAGEGRRELRDVAAIDRGILRHPLFGNRDRWYTTKVKKGFASGALEETADGVAEDVGDAIDTVLDKIGGK